MGDKMPLIWMALGLVFVCALVWAMPAISPSTSQGDWEWIASTITLYIIVLTMIGGTMFVLFGYLVRR